MINQSFRLVRIFSDFFRYATGVTTALQNTAIVSERPHFFFEINESRYYVLNLPALH